MKNIKIQVLIYLLFVPFALSAQSNDNASYIPANDSIINELISQVHQDSVQSYIQSLEDFGTRFMMAPNRKEVANWIGQKFESFGINHVRIDSVLCETHINYQNLQYDTLTWQYNVCATLPGIENTDEYYVIGAHYDNVVTTQGDPMLFAPGADDNASGVAALLEIARIFTQHNYYPKKSIEFVAFAAEELMNFGNSGAEAYVNQAMAHGMDIKIMINNDMIANTNSSEWKIKISNYENCEWLTEMALDITETHTDIEPILEAPSSVAFADCKYFYAAEIPCVYFMEKDFNPFYHTEQDLVSNCEIDYCSEAIKISLGLLVAADYSSNHIYENRNTIALNLYPNPCRDVLHVSFLSNSQNEKAEITITDISGRSVIKQIIGTQSVSMLPINDLSPGIYIIHYTSPNHHGSKRFIKQ